MNIMLWHVTRRLTRAGRVSIFGRSFPHLFVALLKGAREGQLSYDCFPLGQSVRCLIVFGLLAGVDHICNAGQEPENSLL